MRGATPAMDYQSDQRSVSIHAPHAGRDTCADADRFVLVVSIHAPHAGRDPCNRYRPDIPGCFNPRAPCGARRISISAPSDVPVFQSTRPMRGATLPHVLLAPCSSVSIHAPHAGRDGNWSHDFPLLPRIYGHSPPQIRFSRHLSPTPLLRHDSRTYIFTFYFLFTSPSHSVINAQMMMTASKS